MNRFLKAVALAVALPCGTAGATTLLTVNVADPSAVVIEATGGIAELSVTASSFDGLSLLGFFSSIQDTDGAAPTVGIPTFTAGANATTYDQLFSEGTYLNLYSLSGSGVPDTVIGTSAPAFSGALTLDLSAFGPDLPTAGAFGRIALGEPDFTSLSAEFGSYEVTDSIAAIPLPASISLAFAGLLALGGLAARHRRG